MSQLKLYQDAAMPKLLRSTTDGLEIAAELARIGVGFERWEAAVELLPGATQDEIIDAYRESIDRLMNEHGMQSVDVIALQPDHPQRDALRTKFLDEHTHADFEIRFFVDGAGLFCLHAGDQVLAVTCMRGDLISVPAGTRHWFDMGPRPYFKAIRLFGDEAGWIAQFTGDDIASRYPRFDAVA